MIWDAVIQPFADFGFMRRALLGCVAISVGATPVGVFLMLRRMSLTGDAMAHAILPGAQFKEAWRIADKIDSRLEGQVQYCFDSRLGYLTACPSNVGTGLRVSAMIHLPALVASGEIAKTISALGAAGVYVRGLYGEGSGVAGNIFQISNRKTLGQTEEALVAKMERVVGQVIDNEKTARKMLLRESPLDVKDGVYRSLGVLERARKVNFFEALEMLSMVKMGLEMEILPISDFRG